MRKYLAALVTIAIVCFAKGAAAESRRIIDLPGDKCPAYLKASAVTLAMAMGEWSCDSRAELEAHEELMKYANNPQCYSEGWYNDETRRFWRDYDTEQRKKIMEDSRKACNRLKGDKSTAPQTFTMKFIEKEYTFRFDIPVQYDSDDSRLSFKRFSAGADTITFRLAATELERDGLFNSPGGQRGYLGKDAAWFSGSGEYILFARSCEGSCTLEIRLDIFSQSDKSASIFESFKRTLLKGDYIVSSRDASTSAQPNHSTQQGTWFVVVGAWPPAETAKVKSRLALLSNKGIEGRTINTNDYPNLTPGLRAVVLGPFSKEDAQDRLQAVISIVPDAFIKEGS